MPISIALYQSNGPSIGTQYMRPLSVRRCLSYALAGALAVVACLTRPPLPRAALTAGAPRERNLPHSSGARTRLHLSEANRYLVS
jgi:hypothetical protein